MKQRTPRRALLMGALFMAEVCRAQTGWQDPTGTYAVDCRNFELDSGSWVGWIGGFDIALVGHDRIAVSFNLCNGWPSYHLGILEDTAAYDGHAAICGTSEDSACAITLVFDARGLQAVQREEESGYGCGFGANIVADGHYRKLPADGHRVLWYDTLHVDCAAPLRALREHLGHLSTDDLDLLLNSFHPACLHDTLYRAEYSDLLLRALTEAPGPFMDRLNATEERWQLPVVLHTLSVLFEQEDIDLEPVKERVAGAEEKDDWLQQRVLEALDGHFE